MVGLKWADLMKLDGLEKFLRLNLKNSIMLISKPQPGGWLKLNTLR